MWGSNSLITVSVLVDIVIEHLVTHSPENDVLPYFREIEGLPEVPGQSCKTLTSIILG